MHLLSTLCQDLLAELCTVFHDGWRKTCAEVLRASFPPRKAWKTIGNKSECKCCTNKPYNLTLDDSALLAHRLTPSGYCGTVIEHVLLPMVEAATHLCEEHQATFVGLSVCIFVNEFRKIITANKKTYRCVYCDFYLPIAS